jgi:chaperonin GroEL (HSP60 family)
VLRLLKKLTEDRRSGVDIVRRTCSGLIRRIASNAGVDGAIVVERVLEGKGAFGFNANGGIRRPREGRRDRPVRCVPRSTPPA